MNETDDRDLSIAFEQLSAPRSVGNYAEREPTVAAVDRVRARRWPQAVATVLAVLVALAGAGTFLALRNARQNGSATSAGYPEARTGAAMAYDSTSGVTVMYGGTSGSGTALSDTWLWNGSTWSSLTGSSPGPLVGVRVTDDPADGGVLMIGVLAPPAGVPVSGCAVASSGAVTGGSTGGGSTIGPGVITVTPATFSGVPVPSPVVTPSATLHPGPRSSAAPEILPTATCAGFTVPVVNTFLFAGDRWTRVDKPSSAGANSARTLLDTPPAGAQLAFDAASGQVIAVSAVFGGCGPPLGMASGAAPSAIACPVYGAPSVGAPSTGVPASGSAGAAAPYCQPLGGCPTPCPLAAGALLPNCPGFTSSVTTWTWLHGAWTQRRGAIVPDPGQGAVLFSDTLSGHALLVTQTFLAPQPCAVPLSPPANAECSDAPPQITATYAWSGSAWSASANPGGGFQNGPVLGGASSAAVGGQLMVLTATGQLWSWAAPNRQWTRQVAVALPELRTGGAIAEGPSQSIVLFGGVRVGLLGTVVSSVATHPGDDTWLWNGTSWRRLGGSLPPLPAPTDPLTPVRVGG